MKKVSIVIALIAAALISQAQSTYSAGVMGYTKKTIPVGGLIMVTIPFVDDNNAELTIDAVFGSSVPAGTELYAYDNGYTVYTYYEGAGWYDNTFAPAGSVALQRGQGLWVKNVDESPLELLLSGNVPGNSFQSATNSLPQGFALIGGAYPATGVLSNLTQQITPSPGDEIYVYNSDYTVYTYYEGAGWYDHLFNPADDAEIKAGAGFWYSTSVSNAWVQAKPYSDF